MTGNAQSLVDQLGMIGRIYSQFTASILLKVEAQRPIAASRARFRRPG
jgi:hypothetical protein